MSTLALSSLLILQKPDLAKGLVVRAEEYEKLLAYCASQVGLPSVSKTGKKQEVVVGLEDQKPEALSLKSEAYARMEAATQFVPSSFQTMVGEDQEAS